MNFKTEAECKVTYAARACENIGKKENKPEKRFCTLTLMISCQGEVEKRTQLTLDIKLR